MKRRGANQTRSGLARGPGPSSPLATEPGLGIVRALDLNSMNNTSRPRPASTGKSFGLAMLLLTLVLGFLFSDSLKSGFVLFSNDGPLGVAMTDALKLPAAFTGYWVDLNWVGSNGTTSPVSVTYFFLWLLGPVAFLKFYAPITLLLLGASAWAFGRTLGLRPAFCTLGALAAALNMNYFSNTCWGLGTRSLTLAAALIALAALMNRRVGNRWLNAILAGLAVGMGVIEGADNGAIFSLFIAAFVVFQSFVEGETLAKKFVGATRLGLVAVFAGLIAAQVLVTLLGIASKGSVDNIAAPAEERAPELKWAFATAWSLPPVESLRVIIPGLFGYRMDTPNGGEYWGGVGADPLAPSGSAGRSSGAGEYAGVLVVLIGLWALAQSLSRSGSGATVFTDRERKHIWFWSAMFLVALVLSWGRHAPFYQFVYKLPYFSTIRNPMKFMHPGHMILIILFAYGLLGLSRRYLEGAKAATFSGWWGRAQAFEERWALGSLAALGLSVLAFLIYSGARSGLTRHLSEIGLAKDAPLEQIARFSINEVGLFVVFLGIAVFIVLLLQAGVFAGGRAGVAAGLMGLVLVVDLSRSNTPWIQHYDYVEKYASNGVLDLLKDKPYEHRTTVFPLRMMQNQQIYILNNIYQGLWIQHHFQYHNIQSLDMAQEPRPPADKQAYLQATGKLGSRLWELTNTRYLLGLASPQFVDVLNQQLDGGRGRFKLHTPFAFTQSPGSQNIGAQTNDAGPWAVIEFTGALPRAKLYSQWQVSTNDDATLATLGSTNFNPAQTVLVKDAIAAPPSTSAGVTDGRVEITGYAPKHIELSAQATVPSVLLLNDKFDPAWIVSVDGQPAKLLRCNYLMRGVEVPAGAHKIAFHFQPSLTGMKITAAFTVLGLVLCGLLFVVRPPVPENEGAAVAKK